MQPTEIMTTGSNAGDLSLSRPAETVLREADMVAKPWGNRVNQLGLYKKIGESKHLYIEAWQMLGAMYRVTARIRDTRFVDMGEVKGWEATAEAFHIPTGQILSTADAMCLNDEEKWGPRTKYEFVEGQREAVGYVNTPLQQLRSMAQTRAMSKVLSNLFKWIARMEGYQGTPAEEMTDDGHSGPASRPQGPQRKSAPTAPASGVGAGTISEQQAKRMYAIAMQAKLSKEDYASWLKSQGFGHSREVTSDKYDGMIQALEHMGKEADQ